MKVENNNPKKTNNKSATSEQKLKAKNTNSYSNQKSNRNSYNKKKYYKNNNSNAKINKPKSASSKPKPKLDVTQTLNTEIIKEQLAMLEAKPAITKKPVSTFEAKPKISEKAPVVEDEVIEPIVELKPKLPKASGLKEPVEPKNKPSTKPELPQAPPKKVKRKLKKSVFHILLVGLLCFSCLIICLCLKPKFKNVTIELGTKAVTLNNFLVSQKDAGDAKLITDLTKLDFSKPVKYEIKLSYKGKVKTVKLKIVDTTAPVVTFQDVIKRDVSEVNPEDFILEKSDLSELTVTTDDLSNFKSFQDYVIKVTVTDASGNKTSQKCILTLAWLKPLVELELGAPFSKQDVIVNMEKDAAQLVDSEIAKVDAKKAGEYLISANYDGKEYTSQIIVRDTIAPKLELKSVTIFVDKKIKDVKDFVKSVSDASDDITLTLKTNIDYTKMGSQDIVIEAVDASGNKTEKQTTLTIKKDNNGPVFSGIKELKVDKNVTIDYLKGVSAVDAKDGVRDITVDVKSVNLKVAGTYYAVYSAVDKENNQTTVKRKIIVNHDADDTEKKFDEFFKKYLAGKSALEMTTIIRSKITYSHNAGGKDPIWFALNNLNGDCYVHALMLKKAFDKAGINNVLIYVTNKTHYWNLVELDGKWRHYDSTPGSHIKGPATDTEKYNSSGLGGRNWDRSAFPKAV